MYEQRTAQERSDADGSSAAQPRAENATQASATGSWSPVQTGRRRRASIRNAVIERMGEDEVRWRSLGALFAAGGLLAVISLLLPAPPHNNGWAILALGCAAIVSSLLMILGARVLPSGDIWVSIYLAFGTVLITLAILFAHTSSSAFALLYVWVGFDGFFFLPRASAWRHMLFVGLAYGVTLISLSRPGDAAAAHWMLTMGTVTVVGVLTDVLRERSDRLVGRMSVAARTDPLTGLLNRRGFEQLMSDELARASRSNQPISLLVGDLDHFKEINDRFGHHQGDLALERFSDLVRDLKRRIDGAARIGGEEFALVLPDTDEHGGYLMAERVRRQVRESLSDGPHRMSISFGVVCHPLHGNTAAELLHHADQALYLAKRLGRDRSVLFSAEVAPSLRSVSGPHSAAVEQLPAVLVLAETLDLRDTGTAQHSHTVGRYAEAIATGLGLEPARVERIRLAGLLHDIGKIGVPDPILRKPEPLTDAERAEVRKHPELGARIIAGANLDDISGWVLCHHERPDGRGYPSGLHGEEIPLEARILSVADSFEAMTTNRVYQSAVDRERAIGELQRNAGTQFDPEVVAVFLASQGDIHPQLA